MIRTTIVALLLIRSSLSTPAAAQQTDGVASESISAAFVRLDDLGRDWLAGARYVELRFEPNPFRDGPDFVRGWLVDEDDESLLLLQGDLVPWRYSKADRTVLPASWAPDVVRIRSIQSADFDAICRLASVPPRPDEFGLVRRDLRDPGPSHRFLLAHAAWKRGDANLANLILNAELGYSDDPEDIVQRATDDLAWLHFLRAVNLLMFADRDDVVLHLELVLKLSPNGPHAKDARDLRRHLIEQIVEEYRGPETGTVLARSSDRASELVAQLPELRCGQMGQPGFIDPYSGVFRGRPTVNPPSRELRDMGMESVPALVEALYDDSPTRTVYHWRDFAHARSVWRVSDFAWSILRDITQRELGYQYTVGFTFTDMDPLTRLGVVKQVQVWYEQNKGLNLDDRMMNLFDSNNEGDWLTAAQYFLERGDGQAIPKILDRLPSSSWYAKGSLCELLGAFGDPRAVPALREVLEESENPTEKIGAAIGLFNLGDRQGIPVAINFVLLLDQPYGNWEEPVWLLMRDCAPEAIEALRTVVLTATPIRANEVIEAILRSMSGHLWGEEREETGCIGAVAALVAALDRRDRLGHVIGGVRWRVCDSAASALAKLRAGSDEFFGPDATEIDPSVFDASVVDDAKRDEQIARIGEWYMRNLETLVWNSEELRVQVSVNP